MLRVNAERQRALNVKQRKSLASKTIFTRTQRSRGQELKKRLVENEL